MTVTTRSKSKKAGTPRQRCPAGQVLKSVTTRGVSRLVCVKASSLSPSTPRMSSLTPSVSRSSSTQLIDNPLVHQYQPYSDLMFTSASPRASTPMTQQTTLGTTFASTDLPRKSYRTRSGIRSKRKRSRGRKNPRPARSAVY